MTSSLAGEQGRPKEVKRVKRAKCETETSSAKQVSISTLFARVIMLHLSLPEGLLHSTRDEPALKARPRTGDLLPQRRQRTRLPDGGVRKLRPESMRVFAFRKSTPRNVRSVFSSSRSCSAPTSRSAGRSPSCHRRQPALAPRASREMPLRARYPARATFL